MNLPAILSHLQKGQSIKNSALVKNINVVINLVAVAIASAAQVGLVNLNPDDVMSISGHAQEAVITYAPWAVMIINTWTHVATTNKIGLPAKK